MNNPGHNLLSRITTKVINKFFIRQPQEYAYGEPLV